MFYTPKSALEFSASADLKVKMALVRQFVFDHGLLGTNTKSVDDVAIKFPDGTVHGKPDRVRLTFDQNYMQLAAQGLKTVPIWEFHGQLDSQVSVNDSRAIETAFKGNGDPYTLTVYATGGHGIWDQVYARADLWTWLYQQKR